MSNKKKGKKRGFVNRLFRSILKILLYGFLFSIIYIFICKWFYPPITITQIVSVLSGDGLKRDYVDMDEISDNMKLAVIAGEDQLFPDHNGFDFKSIQKARKHNQTSKSLRGASTISQQVAKNVFLWQHGGYFRKGLEVYFTFMIEKMWSKQRILAVYLNVAETGAGIFGVEAASQHFFKKSAKNLSKIEAAQIAASLPNPKVFTIVPLSRRVASRSQWIVRQMNYLKKDPDIQELLQ